MLEKCALEERTHLGSGNASIEAYCDNMREEVDNDPEQRALRQRDHLHAMAIFNADTLATSLAPKLATALRASFAKGLRSQFEADFAETLQAELDDALIETLLLRLSALLPEALSAVATLNITKENPAKQSIATAPNFRHRSLADTLFVAAISAGRLTGDDHAHRTQESK